jgi:hypothetical protein
MSVDLMTSLSGFPHLSHSVYSLTFVLTFSFWTSFSSFHFDLFISKLYFKFSILVLLFFDKANPPFQVGLIQFHFKSKKKTEGKNGFRLSIAKSLSWGRRLSFQKKLIYLELLKVVRCTFPVLKSFFNHLGFSETLYQD